ncbi:MAG: DNA topoisomerase I [Candidatus Woesearchaeota archaeon]
MELIITEKPSSMRKIAQALADNKAESHKNNSVEYLTLTHEGREITVVSAVGHLYTVAEKEKNGWTYPVFETEWVPSADASKDAAFTRKYLTTIKKLAKTADTITIATDFDIEGEVIGYTILKYACKKEDANRMQYSTVTVDELRNSYKNKHETIEWGQAHAGVTRHELDWYYGINLSRALTNAVKAAGSFKILSSGRVQTPALKILADKEQEIAAFTPVPYWEVELTTKELTAKHEQDRFEKEEEAKQAHSNVTKQATVTSVDAKESTQAPPHPFDLTTMQTEAYRSFSMSPKETLSHAQDLYSQGYISYPRTSSQQLPESVGYKKVLEALTKQTEYKKLAEQLLKKTSLKPNNGKKKDPAHPAIYPTGEKPTKIEGRKKKVYDLVVRRFMATFAEAAKRETMTISLESGGEGFKTKGTRTTSPGWHEYYAEHVKQSEDEMPKLSQGQTLTVKNCEIISKETQPPRRYTPSSIIKELEKRGLGTKATRADIIENLFSRGYVHENSIQVTQIGLHTISTLEKYVPEIIDEALTKEIEEELEEIREKKTTQEAVLEKSKKHLTELLNKFKKHEQEIGAELLAAQQETRDLQTMLGLSPKEEEGLLQMKKSRYGYFVGSTKYPDCTSTWSLPSNAYNTPAHKRCPWCKYPLIETKKARRGKELFCFNKECESRKLTPEAQKRVEEVQNNTLPNPKGEGVLVVREGMYGTFIAADIYPKSRYTENLENIWSVESKERLKEAETIPLEELERMEED